MWIFRLFLGQCVLHRVAKCSALIYGVYMYVYGFYPLSAGLIPLYSLCSACSFAGNSGAMSGFLAFCKRVNIYFSTVIVKVGRKSIQSTCRPILYGSSYKLYISPLTHYTLYSPLSIDRSPSKICLKLQPLDLILFNSL